MAFYVTLLLPVIMVNGKSYPNSASHNRHEESK